MAGQHRFPWAALWDLLTSDKALVIVSALAAFVLLSGVLLPDFPSPESRVYTRSLVEVQARLSNTPNFLRALNMFRLLGNVVLNLLLTFMGVCLALRLVDASERMWQQHRLTARSRWILTLPLLIAQAAALFFLIGLLIYRLWGWQIGQVLVQSGDRVAISDGRHWIAADAEARQVTHSRGVVVAIEEWGPGVDVRVIDSAGRALVLLQKPEAEPVSRMSLTLIEDAYLGSREAQFAIPEAGLIVRLLAGAGANAHRSLLYVQVYRSPSGELAVEQPIEGDVYVLPVDGARIHLTRRPYALVTVVANPGRWLSSAGIILCVLALLVDCSAALLFRRRHGSEVQDGR